MTKPRGSLADISKALFGEDEIKRIETPPRGIEVSALIMVFKSGVSKPIRIVRIGDMEDIKLELDNSTVGPLLRYFRDLPEDERDAFLEQIKEAG